jgi:PAS domain S-box-containing protein
MRRRINRNRPFEELKESEAKFRILAEKSYVGLYLTYDHLFKYVNPRLAEIFGYEVEELVDLKGPWELAVPEDCSLFEDNLRRCLSGEIDPLLFQFSGVKKDGEIISVEFSGSRMEYLNNLALVGTMMDITQRKRTEETLQTSEERYRTLFEESRDAICITNRDGRLIDVNQSFLSLFGYLREWVKDLNFRELYVDPDEGSRFQQKIEQMGSLRDYEVKLLKKDRARMDCLITATVRRDSHGSILGYQGIIRDITDLKRVQDTLRESEERFRRLLENANDAIYTHDLVGNLTWVNQEATRIYGYSTEELLKLNITQIVDPEYLPLASRKIRENLNGASQSEPYELLTYSKEGKPIWVEVSTRLLEREPHRVEVLNIARDITERKRVEKRLLIHQEQLRSLASELSLTEERERRRIAVELHDRVGQLIAMAKIKLGMLRESKPFTYLSGPLDEIRALIDQAIQNARSLTFELSPPILHELGFEASVHWLSEQMEEKHGIPAHLEDDLEPKPLDDDIRVVLFTAVRELLANVAKHAQAHKVSVSLRRDSDKIRINVEDDGIGFDTSQTDPHMPRISGFGLFSIRERLSHFGGHLEIDSRIGIGTRVNLMAPLKCKI